MEMWILQDLNFIWLSYEEKYPEFILKIVQKEREKKCGPSLGEFPFGKWIEGSFKFVFQVIAAVLGYIFLLSQWRICLIRDIEGLVTNLPYMTRYAVSLYVLGTYTKQWKIFIA